MNKKFMIVALMATLSATGYAYSNVKSNMKGSANANSVNSVFAEVQEDVNKINNSLAGKADQADLDTLKNQVSNNTATTTTNSQLIGNLTNNKADKSEVEDLKTQVENNTATTTTNSQLIGDLTNNKADKSEVEDLKTQVENNTATTTTNSQLIGDLTNNKADKSEVEDLKTQVGKNEQAIQGNTQQIEDLHKQDANLQEQISNNADAIQGNTQQIVDLNNSKLDKEQYENDKLAQEKRDEEQDGKIDNVSNRLESFKDQVNKDNAAQNDIIANNTQDIDDLKENKVDKNTYEEDKKAQADKDAAQDKNIQANKDAIAQNKNDIAANKAEQDKVNAAQKENNEQQQTAINQNKNDIAANKAEQDKVNAAQKENNEQQQTAINQNKNDIADLRNDYTQVNGRLSGLEKKVDHLDDKMNKGLSLMAAMNAVDFQNVQTGEMALGAGIGHYGNAQSVALGVAYSPVEDLTVNAKYSITAGDPDSFAVGAGATYKFKVGR